MQIMTLRRTANEANPWFILSPFKTELWLTLLLTGEGLVSCKCGHDGIREAI
jgi:hypothetical protein